MRSRERVVPTASCVPRTYTHTHQLDAHIVEYILNKFLSICLIQPKILQPPPVVIHGPHMCRQAQLFFWTFIWRHKPHTRTHTNARTRHTHTPPRRRDAVAAKYLLKIPTTHVDAHSASARFNASCLFWFHLNGRFSTIAFTRNVSTYVSENCWHCMVRKYKCHTRLSVFIPNRSGHDLI